METVRVPVPLTIRSPEHGDEQIEHKNLCEENI